MTKRQVLGTLVIALNVWITGLVVWWWYEWVQVLYAESGGDAALLSLVCGSFVLNLWKWWR